jgi:hypothetical protein
MTTMIVYDPDQGLAVADGRAETVARALANNEWGLIGSWLVCDYLRAFVAEGDLEDVTIIYRKRGPGDQIHDQLLTVNPDGTLSNWPEGMDVYLDVVARIINGRRNNA